MYVGRRGSLPRSNPQPQTHPPLPPTRLRGAAGPQARGVSQTSPRVQGRALLPGALSPGPSESAKAKSPGTAGRAPPLPVPVPSRRPPQMAVSQRTVCCRRQGGVPDLRGSGPRRQLGRMGMLSCLQRPRSGRWRALISLHTQRLRSITSSSLPSRSRACGGGGGGGSGSGSAGWVCAARGGVGVELRPRP